MTKHVFSLIVTSIMTLCIPKLSKKNFYLFCIIYIRISGKNINFDDKKIKQSTFYKNKRIYSTHDIDVNNILVSKKEPYGKKNSLKYFIGYNVIILLDHYL